MYQNNLQGLRRLARQSLKTDWLRRWWVKKYSAPPTDPRYLAYTTHELLLEYFEDAYEENPASFARWDARDSDDGAVITGDDTADDVERRLAAGESLEDILSEWEDEGKAAGKASDVVVESGLEDEEIDDDYTRLPSAD